MQELTRDQQIQAGIVMLCVAGLLTLAPIWAKLMLRIAEWIGVRPKVTEGGQ